MADIDSDANFFVQHILSKILNTSFISILMAESAVNGRLSLCISLAKTAEGLCSLLSPSVVQWDAMTVFMECMVSQIIKSVDEEVKEQVFCNRMEIAV